MISRDGERLETIATGFRNPGGIGVGPDGQITTGENDGSCESACLYDYTACSAGTSECSHQLDACTAACQPD